MPASSWRHVCNVNMLRGDRTCCYKNEVTKYSFIKWNETSYINEMIVCAQLNLRFMTFKKHIIMTDSHINMFYVTSRDKVIMWVSSWVTAANIYFYFKKLRWNWCLLLLFMKMMDKCTVCDVTIILVKV